MTSFFVQSFNFGPLLENLTLFIKVSNGIFGIYLNGVTEEETGLVQLNGIVVLCQFLASFTTSMAIHFPFLVFHIKPDCIQISGLESCREIYDLNTNAIFSSIKQIKKAFLLHNLFCNIWCQNSNFDISSSICQWLQNNFSDSQIKCKRFHQTLNQASRCWPKF